MTSLAEVEEDSFNSTSYFDNLKLNSSCNNKSWVELVEEEEMEEEYSRSQWTTLAKTEGSKVEAVPVNEFKFLRGNENVGTVEVPAVVDRKPASPVFERVPASPKPEFKPLSPVFIKREVNSDEEVEETVPWEEVREATSGKLVAQVKPEPVEAKVKAEVEDGRALVACEQNSRPPSHTEEDRKDRSRNRQSPAESLSRSKNTHKRQRHRSPDRSRKRETRCSDSSVDEKKDAAGQSSHDQNPAELLFNFESVRKRRHPRNNSDEGREPNKRGVRYWNREDAAKKQRRNLPYRDSSMSSSQDSLDKKKPRKPVEYEKDPVVLARRQKQIDYGKNTVGYDNYLQQVPKHSRTRHHPRTPPKYMKYSRRAWDGMVRIWRQQLHFWDTPSEDNTDNFLDALKDDKKMEDTNSGDEKKEDSCSLADSVETGEPPDVLDIGI